MKGALGHLCGEGRAMKLICGFEVVVLSVQTAEGVPLKAWWGGGDQRPNALVSQAEASYKGSLGLSLDLKARSETPCNSSRNDHV